MCKYNIPPSYAALPLRRSDFFRAVHNPGKLLEKRHKKVVYYPLRVDTNVEKSFSLKTKWKHSNPSSGCLHHEALTLYSFGKSRSRRKQTAPYSCGFMEIFFSVLKAGHQLACVKRERALGDSTCLQWPHQLDVVHIFPSFEPKKGKVIAHHWSPRLWTLWQPWLYIALHQAVYRESFSLGTAGVSYRREAIRLISCKFIVLSLLDPNLTVI
jgi:hypothetical protein